MLGTYGQELLVYSQREDRSWGLDWQRSLQAPILAIKHEDLTGVLLNYKLGEAFKKTVKLGKLVLFG